jgi:hypothetical protein
MIIGRTALEGDFVVDVSKKFMQNPIGENKDF